MIYTYIYKGCVYGDVNAASLIIGGTVIVLDVAVSCVEQIKVHFIT